VYPSQLPLHVSDDELGQEVKTFEHAWGVQTPDWQVNRLLHYIA
jgi:hypothetical protein